MPAKNTADQKLPKPQTGDKDTPKDPANSDYDYFWAEPGIHTAPEFFRLMGIDRDEFLLSKGLKGSK